MTVRPLLYFVFASVVLALAPTWPTAASEQPPGEDAWVEATLASMTTAERVGQVCFVRTGTSSVALSLDEAGKLIKTLHLGGAIIDGGTAEQQAKWTAKLSSASAKTPLLLVAGTLPAGPALLTQGAANDAALTRKLAKLAAVQLHDAGFHAVMGPPADLSLSPDDASVPSFGSDPVRAGRLAQAYTRGLNDGNMLAFVGSFPGRGGATSLEEGGTYLSEDRRKLDSTAFVPFRMLMQEGASGVVSSHLSVPALDTRPTSLSSELLRATVRERWGYNGLVLSDNLSSMGGSEFKGLKGVNGPNDLALAAFMAGNDVLVGPADMQQATAALVRAVTQGKLSPERLDASVRRVLRTKYRSGLGPELVLAKAATKDNAPGMADLSEQLYRKSVTVLRDRGFRLPVVRVDSLSTAILSLGAAAPTEFGRTCAEYTRGDILEISGPLSGIEQQRWLEQLSSYRSLVVGMHGITNASGKSFGLLPSHLSLLRSLPKETRVLLVVFGTPYALESLVDFPAVVVAYENTAAAQKAAAEVIYGATPGFGKLPVTVRRRSGLTAGAGLTTAATYRLRRSTTTNAGFSESGLARVDKLVADAVQTRATPGGVVLAAHEGEIGLYRAYGRQTYDKKSLPIDVETVYDLASITKVAAATLSIMRLHEQGKISIYDRLEDHLPWTEGTNKGALVIRDVLAHEARLRPWIPFYQTTLLKAETGEMAYLPGIYADKSEGEFTTPVTSRLFISKSYKDSIYTQIATSELLSKSGYRYSDLGFYIMASIVEQKTGVPLDVYVEREFYRPLGLRTMGYNPLKRMDIARVPPTEEDDYFRIERIQGYVHDMGAAMIGGVSGHAGLFSDARDLATIMQMMLNKGYYGGQRYFKEETVQLFTTRHPESTRRGLGWDMAELSSRGSTNMSPLASAKTFGHLGFTGTCAWADPETDIVFVFLTNRTYPKMTPNTFGKENYRPRMQGAVYESLIGR